VTYISPETTPQPPLATGAARRLLSSFYPCPLAPPVLASERRASPPTAVHAPPPMGLFELPSLITPLSMPPELI
jgi:hypothetical protein